MGPNLQLLIKLLIFGSFPTTILCLFETCDTSTTIPAGTISYVQSDNYPGYYAAGSSCRRTIQAPTDYQIKATCTIEIYSYNGGCTTDAFYIEREGDRSLAQANYYCGTQTIVPAVTSIWNTITFANIGSRAGRWRCSLEPIYNSKGVCDCGWSVSQFIVNGQVTSKNQFPPMVGLVYKTETLPFCGAAIISHRYIFSAAHCFSANNNANSMVARVGEQDMSITGDTRYEKNYDILQIIVHASYSPATHQNDIALLRTTIDITWQRGVAPICLPFNSAAANKQFVNSNVSIPGWGSTDYGYPQSKTLLYMNANVVSIGTCQAKYPGTTITPSQICVQGTNQDSCQHDSGGSLIMPINGKQFSVGLVSFGDGCNNGLPSVNTRVTSFTNWILANTVATNFCAFD